MVITLLVATSLAAADSAPKHRLTGLASYYARCLDGSLTSTGEIVSSKVLAAAHRTLPLGTILEVTSRATGRSVRVRVNDRGPFHPRFTLDLTYAAASRIGVHTAHDRHVTMKILKIPGRPTFLRAAPATSKEARARQIRGSCGA